MAENKVDIESLCVNVIRGLAMDAPHRAKSGHQGTAMALAPLATYYSAAFCVTAPNIRTGSTVTALFSVLAMHRYCNMRCFI